MALLGLGVSVAGLLEELLLSKSLSKNFISHFIDVLFVLDVDELLLLIRNSGAVWLYASGANCTHWSMTELILILVLLLGLLLWLLPCVVDLLSVLAIDQLILRVLLHV